MRTASLIAFIACAFSYVNAQYCTSGGPSQTIDSNVESVSMTGSSGAINYTGCPGMAGVQLSSETCAISAGNSFTLNVQFGTCGGNYAGAGQVWIDYNQNLVFEQSETVGTWSGTPPTALSVFNFTVPLTALQGSTRMRVMQHEAGSLPLDPCAAYAWGSVTDFVITIASGVDCSSYSGDDMADAIAVNTLPYTDNHSNSVCYSNQNPIYASPDVFYKVAVDPASPFITASLCGSSFDTYITAMEPNGTVITGNDDDDVCGPQSEITFNTGGLPYVYIIVEGWGNLTGDYTLNISNQALGTKELAGDDLILTPNPAGTWFAMNNQTSGKVEIRDTRGHLVQTSELKPGMSVAIDELANGVYFVTFTTNDHFVTKKLLKRL